MKNHSILKKISIGALSLILAVGCVDWDDNLERPNEPLLIEVSPNDPHECGLGLSCTLNVEIAPPLTSLPISQNLPQSVDLSEFMPPVRSQGGQGSCTAWATTYYMKSYMEKVQYGYDYNDYSSVMSPAFIYNQIKINGNCANGSCIESALYVLKTKGTSNWLQFPYDDQNCTTLPNQYQLDAALNHRIGSYYKINPNPEINGQTFTRLEIFKNLLHQGTSIVIAAQVDQNFKQAIPRNSENVYICNSFNPLQYAGSHAMLVVGYSDTLNAFKVVNSWGSAWANDGYCWLSYDFFRLTTDPQCQEGVVEGYIAYN